MHSFMGLMISGFRIMSCHLLAYNHKILSKILRFRCVIKDNYKLQWSGAIYPASRSQSKECQKESTFNVCWALFFMTSVLLTSTTFSIVWIFLYSHAFALLSTKYIHILFALQNSGVNRFFRLGSFSTLKQANSKRILK